MLLLRGLLDITEVDAAGEARKAQLSENFAALAAIESATREQSARLVAHPHVSAWLVNCLKQIRARKQEDLPRPLWADLGHLGGFVVAAAIAACTEVEAAVPACNGQVSIPTVGDIFIGNGPGWEMTTVRHLRDGTLTVVSGGGAVTVQLRTSHGSQRLRKVRHLNTSCDGLAVDLELDDLDPYRDSHRLGVSGRLSDSDVEGWRQKLGDAWGILASRHPDAAALIARQLCTLVPLTARGLSGVSATSPHAPGAVALTPPRDGTRLACTLVHEIQHTKLCLLMELAPLEGIAIGRLFYSPWRDDPRALTGLLQGVYAGAAVAEFWRIEYQLGGSSVAAFQFARARRQVEAALDSLSSLGPLVDPGSPLVAALRDVATLSSHVAVSARYVELANGVTLDHAVRWRLRNLTPSTRDVDRLVSSWSAGTPPPKVSASTAWSNGCESFTEDTRLRMVYAALLDQDSRYAYPGRMEEIADATGSDVHLVAGDYEAATRAFERDIKVGVHPVEAWSGLAVALHGQSDPVAAALALRPELVRAVYDRLADSALSPPSPVELARWMVPLVANLAD